MPPPTRLPTPVDSSGYIVTFAPGTAAVDPGRASLPPPAPSSPTRSRPSASRSIDVPDGSTVVADLRADGNVSRVELDRVRTAEADPSDTSYGDQWSLPKIGWDNVYGTVVPSGSAVVALLDTGVDALASRPGWPARRRDLDP